MGKINMKKFQRGIAFVLSLCMCLSLMSLSAFAEEDGNTQEPPAATNVAKIGDRKYATLAEAISAAGTGDTVELTEDVLGVSTTIEIGASANIVLDLAGHTISTFSDKDTLFNSDNSSRNIYALENNGTIELIDSSVDKTGKIVSRGVSNNENAVMTVTSGNYYACNANGGAAIWNEGSLTINGGVLKAEYAGTVAGEYGASCLGNQSTGTAVINDGTLIDKNERCYAITNCGDLTIKNATVFGVHGALSCDYGKLTVNGGSFTADSTKGYYGLWITNDGDCTEVTVNGGTFQGGSNGKNALRASVDDGKQDVSDATIVVTGGTFIGCGTEAAAVAVNKSKSVHSWGMSITGGTFSTEPDSSYLADGYAAVKTGSGYVVVKDGGSYDANKDAYVAKIGSAGYTTLAAAFGAARANDTITLTQDCETGSKYTIAEPLYLTAKGATLDLNKKTITVTKNFSFLIQGDGITVKNGLIRAGSNSNSSNKTGINSYGLVVNGCDGVTIDGVTSVGGFSIGGDGDKGGTPGAAAATNVTIKNCNVTSGDWYTVCAQQNSTVTIESGVYTADSRSANSGVIQGTFKGSDGPKGTVTVTGGTFNGRIKNNDKGDIVIKGGTFNVDPSAYVPTEGYAAIEVETGKTWQVGEVKENNDGTTTTTATDTQTKVENGETLTTKTETVVVKNTDNSTTTAQTAETRDAGGNLKQTTYSAVEKDSSGNVTANVTATVESAKAPTTGKPSDALKSNTDADALAQRASNSIDPTNLDLTTDLMQSKAKEFADEALAELKQQQSQGGTDTNVDVKVDVTIKTTLTNYTVGSGDQSVTYNVSPILLAQVTVGSNAPVEKEKPIGNDKLKGSIPVRLPIPDSFATAVAGATTVQIKHIHGDGTSEIITGTIGGTTGGYYVDFSVTGFSSFQILPAGKSFPAPSTNTTTSGSGWSGWSGIGGGYSGSSNNGNSGNNAAQPNSQPVTIDEGGVPLSEFPLMFADVAENAWYRNAIAYVFREGLMKGVSDTKFGPADDTTRGMVSLILMRLADGEAPQTAITFSDVAIESWYADAASWAEMNKIFTGYADGTFRGDVAITREQLATVLYRYAAFCGLTLAEGADISAFGDKDAVSGYAVDAMRWAVAVGLFKGDDRGMLNPANHATRAELATVLMRFADLFA